MKLLGLSKLITQNTEPIQNNTSVNVVVVVVVVEIVAVVVSEEETVESEWEKRKTSDFDRQSTTDNRASWRE